MTFIFCGYLFFVSVLNSLCAFFVFRVSSLQTAEFIPAEFHVLSPVISADSVRKLVRTVC